MQDNAKCIQQAFKLLSCVDLDRLPLLQCPVCSSTSLMNIYTWLMSDVAVNQCRSLQIASDLDSLAKASSIANRSVEVRPTQQAIACCEYIASVGAIAGEEEEEHFREEAALR